MTKLKTVGKSILISGIAVPTLGVLAHFMGGGSFQYNDSKLSHRFECAYSMNPKHKTFTSYEYVNKQVADAWFDSDGNPLNDVGASVPTARVEEDMRHPDYIKFCNEEEYIANPFLTGAMYITVAAGAYAGLRRRKKIAEIMKQMSR